MSRHNSSIRRALALLIALTLMLGDIGPLASLDWGFGVKAHAEAVAAFALGDGTETSPYEIGTQEELRSFAALSADDTKGKFYKLTADITLTGTWEPIDGFAGTFDGNGKTISGLTISNTDSASNVGLFGTVYGDAVIKNLILKNCNVDVTYTGKGKLGVGALIGSIDIANYACNVTVDNCAVIGNSTVTAEATGYASGSYVSFAVGSIVGRIQPENSTATDSKVTVINCFNSAALTAKANGGGTIHMGGIIGAANNNTTSTSKFEYYLFNCGNIGTLTASGTTDGKQEMGGLVGRFRTSGAEGAAQIENCYNAGAITGTNATVRGFVATTSGSSYSIATKVTNSYRVPATWDSTGAQLTVAQVTDGTLLGYLNTNKESVEGALKWVGNEDNYPVPHYEEPFPGLPGEGTEVAPYEIGTEEELRFFAGLSRNDTQGNYYKLTADIDLTADWIPAWGFAGHLDGNDCTISGMTIDATYDAAKDLGLFGMIHAGATIKDVTLKDVHIAVTQTADMAMNAGALVGKIEYTAESTADTRIDNCAVIGDSTVSVTANAIGANAWTGMRVGGLIGNLDANKDASGTTTVINCFNEAAVTVTATGGGGSVAVGGIAGTMIVNGNNATFQLINSGSVGALTASDTVQQGFVGGIAGWTKGQAASVTKPSVDNCYSTGSMTGKQVGNIAAQSSNVTFDWQRMYGLVTGGSMPGTTITADKVTNGALLRYLNNNRKTIEGAFKWVPKENGYPAPKYVPAVTSLTGSGTEADPFKIDSEEALKCFASLSQSSTQGKYYKLTADIALTEDWTPMAGFAGILDGNCHVISGLYITATTTGTYGLFAKVSGTVKNLTVNGTIQVTDTVNDGKYTGIALLTGELNGGTLNNCVSNGSVTTTLLGQQFVGGIAGLVTQGSTIINCGNTAKVTASRSGETTVVTRVGGIAGYAVIAGAGNKDIAVANSYNLGTIDGAGSTKTSGGIFGMAQNNTNTPKDDGTYALFTVSNCYSAGSTDDALYSIAKFAAGKQGTITGKNLYYNQNQEVDASDSFDISAEQFTSATDGTLLEKLNSNIATIADALIWVSNDDGYPVLEQPDHRVTLAWVTPSNGSVVVKQGSTVLKNPVKLDPGTEVAVTVTANAGCAFNDLTVGGTSVLSQMDGNTYTFTVTSNTIVVASFVYTSDVEFFVSPHADGSGTGTQSDPYSLEQALTQIEAMRKDVQAVDESVTVYMMGGTYRLAQTLKLTQAHSSDAGRAIFRNVQGTRPVITGGVEISGGWTDANGDGIYEKQLAQVDGAYPQFRDLYINGEKATLARTQEYTFASDVTNKLESNGLNVSTSALAGVTGDVTSAELCLLVEWKHQIFQLASANTSTGAITLNHTQWDLFNRWDNTRTALGGRPYWLQNHLAFLDEPGEFYYDQAKGTVYYKPYSNQSMDSATVEYGALDILIELDHASNITFDGIRFTGTTTNWITQNGMPGQLGASQYGKQYFGADVGAPIPCAAVFGDYATGITVTNCVFQELGGSGVVLQYGAENIAITGNRMKNLGVSGVSVGVPQAMWNQAAKKSGVDGDAIVAGQVYPGQSVHVTVSNNYIGNIGQSLKNAAAISVKRAEHLRISNNTIVHVPYSGITAGWGMNYDYAKISGNDTSIKWNEAAFFQNLANTEISSNRIEDFMYSMNDGGAIYVNGANAVPTSNVDLNNTIHHNYIRAGAHNAINVGIYHDGAASNWKTTNNFVDDVVCNSGPIFFQDDVDTQYTHHITASNNYSTVSAISQKSGAATTDTLGNARNITLTANTKFNHRGLINDAAWEIMNSAGLQSLYKQLEDPMDAQLRVDDNTMHYAVSKNSFTGSAYAMMRLALTNNTGANRTYTLSFNGLPSGVSAVLQNTAEINGAQRIAVKAGQTKLVEVTFTFTKAVDPTVVGLVLQDNTGCKTAYPRAFTLEATGGLLSSNTQISLVDMYGANILPGETLTMKFFVEKTKLSGDIAADPYYALISRPSNDGKTTVIEKIESSKWAETTNYYSVSTDLVARQMTDILQVQIFNASTNEPVTRVWTDSIKDYVIRIVDNPEQDSLAKPALIDMLYYGAAAQKTLGYALEDLATDGLTTEQIAYATSNDSVLAALENKQRISQGAEHFMGSSIIVGNDLFLKLYFKDIADKTGYRAELEFTNHRNETMKVTILDTDFWKGNSTTYAITVKQLVVADVSTLVTCTLYDADGAVVTQVTDNVGSYLTRQYEKTQSQIYLDVVKFCTSTHSYVHRNDLAA